MRHLGFWTYWDIGWIVWAAAWMGYSIARASWIPAVINGVCGCVFIWFLIHEIWRNRIPSNITIVRQDGTIITLTLEEPR